MIAGLFLILGLAFASPFEMLQNPKEPVVGIIGGDDAQLYEFPYMVSLQNEYRYHECGGAILSPNWVVSSARCFNNTELTGISYAVAGIVIQGNNNPERQSSAVEEVIIHPQYDKIVGNYYDIALVKLAAPFFMTEAVQAVSLPSPNKQPSGTAVVSGWGLNFLSPYSGGISPVLHYLEMVVRSDKECNRIFRMLRNHAQDVGETLFCTVPLVPNESSCFGDDGGPLVQDRVLLGIVQTVDDTCGQLYHMRLPNLFTKVSVVLDFIKQHVTDLPEAK